MSNDILSRLSYDDFVNKMKGEESTQKWDVVFSSTTSKINAALEKKYEAGKLAKYLNFVVLVEDPFNGNYNLSCNIHLDSPHLSFFDGKAILSMPIISPSNVTKLPSGSTVAFPNDYALVANAPLASISGTSGAITPGDQTVIFSDGSDQQHIILHFKNQNATFDFSPAPTGYLVNLHGLTPVVSRQPLRLSTSFACPESSLPC